MKHFDGDICDTFGTRTLLDHARKHKKFYSFKFLQTPWHHHLHIPKDTSKDSIEFKFDGTDQTKEARDTYEKNKMWAIKFKEDDYLEIKIKGHIEVDQFIGNDEKICNISESAVT